MHRLLVVDDEPFIVNGLYEFLLLTSGLELDVYKAYTGDEAVEWLHRTKIDIVITDIRMPGMTGIQLLDTIKRQWPHCRVIFLSGYNEFEYVYQAIQYEGVGYLLKTAGYDKILELVKKAVREIEEMVSIEDLVARARHQMKIAAPTVQKDMLLGLLRGEQSTLELRSEQFRQSEISLRAQEAVLLLLGRLEQNSADPFSHIRLETIFRVKLIVDQYMADAFDSIFLALDDDTLVWIVQPKKTDHAGYTIEQAGMIGQLKGILEMVQETCEKALGISASFVVDGEQVEWEHISVRFTSMRAWVGGMPQIDGKGSILDYTSESNALPYLNTNEVLETIIRQLKRLDLLESLLVNGSKEDCLKLLNEMLESVEQSGIQQSHVGISMYASLSLLFLSYIQTWGMVERLQEEVDLSLLTSMDRLLIPGLKGDYFRQLASLLFDHKQFAHADRADAAVEYIKKYILINLQQDLSLVQLAEVSHFNPSYLSRLFKQVAGVNLNTYIQDARMKRAMELLRDSSLRVHEIAAQVGFEYPPYFTKMFKKNVHMNPQEYRDHFTNK